MTIKTGEDLKLKILQNSVKRKRNNKFASVSISNNAHLFRVNMFLGMPHRTRETQIEKLSANNTAVLVTQLIYTIHRRVCEHYFLFVTFFANKYFLFVCFIVKLFQTSHPKI